MNRLFILCSAALLISSCAPSASVRGGGSGIAGALLEPYNGPKARLAVAQFEDKTAEGYGAIGEGMATMFTTALVNSNRYIVLERDLIDEVIKEQDLASSGRVREGTGAPTGEIEGAELLLTGAVTEFEPEKMGVGGGIIGLGTLIGTALLHEKNENIPVAAATYTESHLALDVRILDTATSRLLAAVSVEGKGQDWGGGLIAEIGGGRTRLPFAFGGFQKSATEKAVRAAIDQAVAEIVRQTPAEYFHVTDDIFLDGRMLGFTYLDIPGTSGEHFSTRGVRTARRAEEWFRLAATLGIDANATEPPVDFTTHQVVALGAGSSEEGDWAVSVENVIGYRDRIEISATHLRLPPPGEEDTEEAGSSRESTGPPLAILRIDRTALPIVVQWTERPHPLAAE